MDRDTKSAIETVWYIRGKFENRVSFNDTVEQWTILRSLSTSGKNNESIKSVWHLI